MPDRASVMAEFDSVTSEVHAEVAALSDEQIRIQPAGEEWQIATIIAHLGTGLLFSRDLSEIARRGDAVNPSMFGKYRARLEGAATASKAELIAAYDAEVEGYRGYMNAMPEAEFIQVFTLTMPSGAQREISGPYSVRQACEHLREHQNQIREWLQR